MTDYTLGQDSADVTDDVTGRVAAKTRSQTRQLQLQRVTGNVIDMPCIPAVQYVNWPRETIIENQRNDKILKRIFVHLDANSKPTEDEIETDNVFRRYVLQWQSLVCENGILYRKFHDETGKVTKLQFIAPRNMQRQILERVHVQLLGHTKTKNSASFTRCGILGKKSAGFEELPEFVYSMLKIGNAHST
jgi:hypothetical protein